MKELYFTLYEKWRNFKIKDLQTRPGGNFTQPQQSPDKNYYYFHEIDNSTTIFKTNFFFYFIRKYKCILYM